MTQQDAPNYPVDERGDCIQCQGDGWIRVYEDDSYYEEACELCNKDWYK